MKVKANKAFFERWQKLCNDLNIEAGIVQNDAVLAPGTLSQWKKRVSDKLLLLEDLAGDIYITILDQDET